MGEVALSVILFCRTHPETVPRVLDGLDRQVEASFPFEVILVDSSPGFRAAEHAAQRHLSYPLEVVASELPLTPGAARNAGMERATGRWIGFLEDDCIPRPDWLARRMRRHREGFAVVAEAVECAEPRTMPALLQWLTRFSGSLPRRHAQLGSKPMAKWSYEASLIRRGFDEDLPLAEDVQLNNELIQEGWRVLFDPAIRVQHIGLGSVQAVKDHHYRHGEATARLASHPEARHLIERYSRRGIRWWYPPLRWATTLKNAMQSGPRNALLYLILTPWAFSVFRSWAHGFEEAWSSRRAHAKG